MDFWAGGHKQPFPPQLIVFELSPSLHHFFARPVWSPLHSGSGTGTVQRSGRLRSSPGSIHIGLGIRFFQLLPFLNKLFIFLSYIPFYHFIIYSNLI